MSDSDNGLDYIADLFGVSEEMRKDSSSIEEKDIIDFNSEINDLNEDLSKMDDGNPLKELSINSSNINKIVENIIVDSVNKTNKSHDSDNKDVISDIEEEHVSAEINSTVDIVSIEDSIEDSIEETDEETDEEKVLKEANTAEEYQKAQEEIYEYKKVKNKNSTWDTENDNPKFNNFYEEKKSLLAEILPGNILPFKNLMNELRESYVDISHPTFDTETASKKMEHVQKVRDRVCQIGIDCNQQYYLWKRGIELMHGLLARTQYEKPAAKQDGLIYEHLQDMEMYFRKLESLHFSVEAVIRNLDCAFECLSRRVTIAMPTRPIERKAVQFQEDEQVVKKEYYSEINSVKEKKEEEEVVPDFLSEYDILPEDATEKNIDIKKNPKKFRKLGKVTYGEI